MQKAIAIFSFILAVFSLSALYAVSLLRQALLHAGHAPRERRLSTFVDVMELSGTLASSGCVSVTDISDLELQVSSKNCNGRRCPPCVVFQWVSPTATSMTFTLSGCSSADMGTSQLGSPGHLANAAMGWTFVNYRDTEVKVRSGGKVPFCRYKGRFFMGDGSDYEDITARCGSPVIAGAFSVAFTLRTDDPTTLYDRIIDFASDTGSTGEEFSIQLKKASDGAHLKLLVTDGATASILNVNAENVISAVARRYLVSISASGDVKFWVDGTMVRELQTGLTNLIPSASRRLRVGISNKDNAPKTWKGLIGDLRLWNEEVTDWYDAVAEAERSLPPMSAASAFCVSAAAAGSASVVDRLVWEEDSTL